VLDAEAYALIVEDPDAPAEHPFIHWMIWNIPGELNALAPGLPQRSRLDHPKGAVQGRNAKGGFGYFGPRPPSGDGPHHYHFELFALDKRLPMDPDTPLPELLNALKGNTIAKADLVGTYEAPLVL
jgi:Raf kinase inhibitor-like YbhB/YbcL family protein